MLGLGHSVAIMAHTAESGHASALRVLHEAKADLDLPREQCTVHVPPRRGSLGAFNIRGTVLSLEQIKEGELDEVIHDSPTGPSMNHVFRTEARCRPLFMASNVQALRILLEMTPSYSLTKEGSGFEDDVAMVFHKWLEFAYMRHEHKQAQAHSTAAVGLVIKQVLDRMEAVAECWEYWAMAGSEAQSAVRAHGWAYHEMDPWDRRRHSIYPRHFRMQIVALALSVRAVLPPNKAPQEVLEPLTQALDAKKAARDGAH